MFPDKPTGLCENCNERDATTWWSYEGGTISAMHGIVSEWCETCAVSAQLDYAIQASERIPQLRERLLELQAA